MNQANVLAATHHCLFGSAESYCGGPAVAHIWTSGDQMTMSCAQHVGWWWTHGYRDLHPIAVACGLPDSFWRYSIESDPGWCEMHDFPSFEAVEMALVGGEA